MTRQLLQGQLSAPLPEAPELVLVTDLDGTLLGRHLQVFRQQAAPEHGANVHVESERGGAAVAANLGRDHGIRRVIGAVAAMRFGHAQRQQT